MQSFDQRDLLHLAREDLYIFALLMFAVFRPGHVFIPADYLNLLAATLQGLDGRPAARQIINMAPRHLKSYLATIAFPSWFLGRHPQKEIMIASHTMALSVPHVRSIRTLMKSDLYGQIFSTCVGAKDTEVEVETTKGGRVLAVSFDAAPTGRGCDALIIDDPLKADDAENPEALEACLDFFNGSLASRLNHPDASFILVVMQRLSLGDLTGRLVETGFTQLSLPLVATEPESIPYRDWTGAHVFQRAPGEVLNPNRMSGETLNSLKATTTEAVFAAQYQQDPRAPDGNIVQRKWLQYVDVLRSDGGTIVQSWDTAFSLSNHAAYSVCLTWRMCRDRFELIDVFRDRVPHDQLGAIALALAKQYRARKILVELENAGFSLSNLLKREGYSVDEIRPASSKAQRLRECLSAFHDLMVFLPRGEPWIKAYEEELLTFPSARYSDQVDATSQFLKWALEIFAGDRKDPMVRMHEPVTVGASTGGGPGYYSVGRGVVPRHGKYNPRFFPRV
jgi:predicted phage terminase large subunit-like protein